MTTPIEDDVLVKRSLPKDAVNLKVKLKQSHYRPGHVQRVPRD